MEISKSLIKVVNLFMVVSVKVRYVNAIKFQEICGQDIWSAGEESKPSLIYYFMLSEGFIFDKTRVISKENFS